MWKMRSLRNMYVTCWKTWAPGRCLEARQSQDVSISHVCSNVQLTILSELRTVKPVRALIQYWIGSYATQNCQNSLNKFSNIIFASCETNISNLVKTDTGSCIIKFLTLSTLSPSCISEFSVGQGDPGRNTFSCYIGDKKYFLCAGNDEVFLMVSNNLS